MEKDYEESSIKTTLRHIWTTYKSRYNANQRLLKTDILQQFSITFVAISILALSVLNLANSLTGNNNPESNAFLIILSIISLALSLTIGRSENKLNAYKYHQCARELQRLYDKIRFNLENLPEYNPNDDVDQYNSILDKYDMNHKKIDWDLLIFEKWQENEKKRLQLIFFWISYFFKTQLLYIGIIVITIISWCFYLL